MKRDKIQKIINCKKCNNLFEIIITKEAFNKGKYKYHCSRKCANGRIHSDNTKLQISKSQIKNLYCDILIKKCKECKRLFICPLKKEKDFCNKKCVVNYCVNTGLSAINGRKGGLVSALIQSEKRRSKNEIEFANLCLSNFKNVEFNKAIFNGWDSDIIIHDLKIAILWNGKWHYEKIAKKHSVEQVQNRDKIKINEIINYGYIPYIIKDLGKFDLNKVKIEWQKFNLYVANGGIEPHELVT